jgi:hypothetical protein
MRPSQSGSILGSVVGIVVCGGIGGLTAWAVVTHLGLQGLFGALVAALIGMVVATGAWIALTWLLRRLRGMR